MKNVLATLFILVCTGLVFSQKNPIQITGGEINMVRGQPQAGNTRLESNIFTAISQFSDFHPGPWGACQGDASDFSLCVGGTTFTTPLATVIDLGDYPNPPSQFVSGKFTLNKNVFDTVYFWGNLHFSQSTFFIPKRVQRKGTRTYRNPFNVKGTLQVCKVRGTLGCPKNQIIWEGAIEGRGTMTIGTSIRTSSLAPVPYLRREYIRYQFTP